MSKFSKNDSTSENDSTSNQFEIIPLDACSLIMDTKDIFEILHSMPDIEVCSMNSLYPTPVHPRKWFEQHVGEKPSVTLPNQAVNLEQVRGTLKKQIFDMQLLESDLVLLYLRKLAENMKSPPLDADWVSFGVLLGSANESIGPLNLVAVVDRDTEVPMLTGSATEKDDNWMLILLAACFRLRQVTDEGYRKFLQRGFASKLREAGLSNTRLLEQVFESNRGDWSHSVFVKMVAILDMYFVRFPDHPLSGARIGTGESRYKECTALKSLLDFSEQIGMSIAEISHWIWTEILDDDFRSITKSDQEIENPYSYTPYAKFLLGQTSAFSSANNPNMHLFIHAVGSALGIKRSVNAKIIKKNYISLNTLSNAVAFSYALNVSKKQQNGAVNPRAWIFMIDENSTRHEEKEKGFASIYTIWANLKDTRAGTIGEYVKTYAEQRKGHNKN